MTYLQGPQHNLCRVLARLQRGGLRVAPDADGERHPPRRLLQLGRGQGLRQVREAGRDRRADREGLLRRHVLPALPEAAQIGAHSGISIMIWHKQLSRIII